MAKYKLKKNYPTCNLEIGSYIEFSGNCQQIINSNGNFLKSDLEKFTEFWEKLEEKEYEIIKEAYNTLIGKRDIPWLECGKDYGTCLDWAVHYKEPILITEDGKELFSGDTFYCVTEHYYIISGEFVSNYVSKTFKYFSTKELAEKYVEENKPMYSRKEVRDFGGYILRNLKGVMPMKLLFELWLREKGN